MDRRRPCADGSGGCRHPAHAAVPEQRPLPARPGDRGPRAAVRDALAVSPVRHGAAGAHLAVPRAPQGPRRVLRRGGRLGAAGVVRATRRRARVRLRLRAHRLVRALGERAPRGARARRPVRPVLVRQVPGAGARCRSGPAADLRQRRRGGARPHRLYAMAERARRHRGRPHRHAARRGRLSGGDQRGQPEPGPALAEAPYPGSGARVRHRRDLGLCGAGLDGAGEPGGARRAHPGRPGQRCVPVRDSRRRSSSAMRWCARSASPTSASSASSCTSRPSSPGRCST